MTREQAKEYVNNHLQDYLQRNGIDTRKEFTCINPAHDDKHPSMSFDRKRNKAHCFSAKCCADYDTIDVVGIFNGVDDYNKKLEIACKEFNIVIDSSTQNVQSYSKAQREIAQHRQTSYLSFIRRCCLHLGQTDYLQKRGISKETAESFLIGYVKDFHTKDRNGNPAVWAEGIVIPTSDSSYQVRNLAVLTTEEELKKERYRKVGSPRIFNQKRGLLQATKPIIVTEGEIDALSIIEVGGNAIALGGQNVHLLLSILKANPPTQPIVLALDNDEPGKAMTQTIADELNKLGIRYFIQNLYGDCKDANEALLKDREEFSSLIDDVMAFEEVAKEAQKEAFFSKYDTGKYLQQFINEINENKKAVEIQTGFKKLDAVLDGGMHAGLHVIGAISSLGKTTFALQIADNVAKAGNDVLIFSLEMGRDELISKSISRLSYIKALDEGLNTQLAKTARGVMDGKRWAMYSERETAYLRDVINEYATYADHIKIIEDEDRMTVSKIRSIIKKYIDCTGKIPLCIVDYLQILAPYDVRATDKQNIDANIHELRKICRDFKLPLIAISSFNRNNYNTEAGMEAFKESGNIEYSADVLIGLQFEGVGKPGFDGLLERSMNPRHIQVVMLKNRSGCVGDKLNFDYYTPYNFFDEESTRAEEATGWKSVVPTKKKR